MPCSRQESTPTQIAACEVACSVLMERDAHHTRLLSDSRERT